MGLSPNPAPLPKGATCENRAMGIVLRVHARAGRPSCALGLGPAGDWAQLGTGLLNETVSVWSSQYLLPHNWLPHTSPFLQAKLGKMKNGFLS